MSKISLREVALSVPKCVRVDRDLEKEMGCCVSRSTAAAAVERRQVVAVDATAAMVMDLDGTMARLEAPVAARVALGGDAYSCFVCGADELDYGAPARAMGDDRRSSRGSSTSCSPSPRSAGRCPATTWPRSPSRPARRSPASACRRRRQRGARTTGTAPRPAASGGGRPGWLRSPS